MRTSIVYPHKQLFCTLTLIAMATIISISTTATVTRRTSRRKRTVLVVLRYNNRFLVFHDLNLLSAEIDLKTQQIAHEYSSPPVPFVPIG